MNLPVAPGSWPRSVPTTCGAVRQVVARYADQEIGVADASNVVLADRHHTRTVVTLDRRHFEVLRPLSGGIFTVLPGRPE